jgi:hypothetical protein
MEKILRSYQGDENYIFVSYAHKDKDLVYPLIRTMQENGYNVWFDEDITPANEFTEYIAENLLRSAFFIAMITPQYLASHYCKHELDYACNLNKKRLLIYLEEVTLTPGLQMMTTDQQAILKYQYSDTSYFYDKLFHSDGIDICKSQSIRFYSGDAADNAFEIENGVLKKYHGDANAVVIPDGVTSIGDFAFQNCESLTAVKIADSVTSIGNFAFWGCGALASVYIPDGLTSIGDGAFQACDVLTAIDLPESVMHLGRCAFNINTRTSTPTPVSEPMNQTWIEQEHKDIQEHTADDEPAVLEVMNPNLFGQKYGEKYTAGAPEPLSEPMDDEKFEREYGEILRKYGGLFIGKESETSEPPREPVFPITDFEIENGVLIGYLGNSETVVIPEGVVTSIGDEAFWECKSPTSIYIPNGVTSIGDWAFHNCTSLTSIHIPNGVTSIGNWVFSDCKSLTAIEIPDSVISIGDQAFFGCEALTSIHIPDSVTEIGEEAFFGCYALSSIEIPASVKKIGKHAFPSNTAIRNKSSVMIPPISDFDIEHGTVKRYLGKSNSVVIPTGVTSIGNNAFSRCNTLTAIVIPDGITSIGEKAFEFCKSLTSIKIPNGVIRIGNDAFACCFSLPSIEIPDSVTSIGDDAFACCYALASIEIPDGVTSIGEGTFACCKSLTSIEIPDSVASIGNEAFTDCYSLTSIEIPDSVTSIGIFAFWKCFSLKSVKIPKSVTHIGEDAFLSDTKIIRV